jgi:hypothetical protein
MEKRKKVSQISQVNEPLLKKNISSSKSQNVINAVMTDTETRNGSVLQNNNANSNIIFMKVFDPSSGEMKKIAVKKIAKDNK